MKIGIYAGTFDPIHNGHINFAVSAVENSELDKVIIVAEKNPYRKKPYASWDHRQAMIERATEDFAEADHDYEFSNALAHQHTMQDMLLTAKKHYGSEHEFWFLVGSDVFEHMKHWQDLTESSSYGGFVVALRDDHTEQWLNQKIEELRQSGFVITVNLVPSPHPHISSKKIRDALKQREVPEYLDSTVREYITAHSLYINNL